MRRFTFGELEGFLEAAKAAIPGTAEAIEAARGHQARKVGCFCGFCRLSLPEADGFRCYFARRPACPSPRVVWHARGAWTQPGLHSVLQL